MTPPAGYFRESVPGETAEPIGAKTAKSWQVVAFFDILVFFGVLMVGFAYLWKRGDIAWVRSRTAQEAEERKAPAPVRQESPALVGAGH
jgi:NADH-quinone oxidoreductase subunit A